MHSHRVGVRTWHYVVVVVVVVELGRVAARLLRPTSRLPRPSCYHSRSPCLVYYILFITWHYSLVSSAQRTCFQTTYVPTYASLYQVPVSFRCTQYYANIGIFSTVC